MSVNGINFILPEPPLVDTALAGPLNSDDSVQAFDFTLNAGAPVINFTVQIGGSQTNAARIYLARRGANPPSADSLRLIGLELQPCGQYSRWLVDGISALEWVLYYTSAVAGNASQLTIAIDTFAGDRGGAHGAQ